MAGVGSGGFKGLPPRATVIRKGKPLKESLKERVETLLLNRRITGVYYSETSLVLELDDGADYFTMNNSGGFMESP